MSKFAINPNALPDLAKEQAAALDRDRAAIHHFDDDGAGETPAPEVTTPLGPPMVTPDPRYRHGDVDVIEARLATLKNARAAKQKSNDAPPPHVAKATDHPLIASLISALPAPGSVWTAEDRANWLRAAESIFHLAYEADEQVKISEDGV